MMLRNNNDNHSQITTPTQRATIQFVESLLISALITGCFAIAPLIESTGPINWYQIIAYFLFAVLWSLIHGVVTYFRPYNPQVSIIETVLDAVERRIQPIVPTPQAPAQSPLVVIHAQTPQIATTTPVVPSTAQPDKDATQPMTNATDAIQKAIAQRQQLPS